jgi:flagellar hook assembly protein FlgD
MKYQLDNLEKGTYYLTLDCYDVNGNPRSMGIEFDVSTQFDIIKVANYPNPVKTITTSYENSARTRFTYVLTDDADKVTLKIYTVSGRLIQTFKDLPTSVGYHEYPRSVLGWDCRDKDGYFLANGVYFYRIVAKKGSKKVEKIQKMAILK